MARPPRIQFQNAFYHVIVRGNQQQALFSGDTDRMAYLELLSRYKKKCGFILYAYVLMNNHIHLLVETPEAPISKIMQMLNFTYAQYFNRKYGKVGHLFQGRYKSFLCDRDQYLLSLVRYIHLNPLVDYLTKDLKAYSYSSYLEFLGLKEGFTRKDVVLDNFGSVQDYERFVLDQEDYGRTIKNLERLLLDENNYVSSYIT